ncbi:MAG: CAP domain-containing protein [Thermoanaerobaculia bacterium]
MRTAARLLPLLLLASFWAAGPAPAQGGAQAEILRRINAERQRAGAPPLRLDPALTRAAGAHAEAVASRGNVRLPAGSTGEMRLRLQRAGYEAHAWVESLASTSGDPESVISNLRRGDPSTWRKILDSEYRDLGVGVDRMGRASVYSILVAVPEADYFARGTSGLRDLERVRAAILARVNAERARAGVAPLRSNEKLDLAAQRHAQDMLARGYFAHASPEGKTVRERARAAGYEWRMIGENIAEGQFSVDEVMDTWMHSPGHRRNILDPGFKELGAGMAMGRSNGTYRVLWAQAFGTKR